MLFTKAVTLEDGKRSLKYFWDFLLFVRRTFVVGEDITIPTDKVLTMHSPIFEGELYVDGEAFIE